jgi:hypothetical protein
MEPPGSLTAQLYLLGYDGRRQRIAGGNNHGLLLRAAALEELRLAGAIADEAGRVRATGLRQVDDQVLTAVLAQINTSDKARSWKHWVTKGVGGTYAAVRDRMDDSLYTRVEHRRVLGIFPRTEAYLRDQSAVDALRALVDRILTGTDTPPPHDAALVALAAVAELGTILPRSRRKAFRDRITQLTDGPVPPALRRAIQARNAAAASGVVVSG